ncbi:hypothetical protein K435DRAFT_852168 [Dendrothele bispora CBS 962.96]|uniref:Uncharacterized protein n=1 Tax=Dendrothele bispora (strain CBS 962.96) TaxID=1314807 RepID=A0A4S8MJZ9_DENBC|nr:hypothetical protein K435DRAFT_852168 [Dendrothele bispora CBS 962.96]
MKFFTSLFTLLVISGLTLAQQQPCLNAADPDNDIGNYCECADGTCWRHATADGHAFAESQMIYEGHTGKMG